MALTLNTNHALYPNLIALICVEGGVLKDLKVPGRTFTKKGALGGVFGSGTFGEHFQTQSSGQTVNGVVLSPSISMNTATNDYSVFWAANGFTGGSNSGTGGDSFQAPCALYSGSESSNPYTPEIAIFANGDAAMTVAYNSPPAHGTFNVSTGAHALTLVRPVGDGSSTNQMHLYADAITTSTFDMGGGYGNGGVVIDTIGGFQGYDCANSKLVYFAVFNKALSRAEHAELYSSLTGSNSFSLVITPTNLVVQNSTQSASSSNVQISITAASLTVQNGVQTASSSNATLGVDQTNLHALNCVQSSSSTNVNVGTVLGTLTTLPLKSNVGMLLANRPGITIHIYQLTGESVTSVSGLTSGSDGVVSISNSFIVPGTTYRFVVIIGSDEGMDKAVAA